MTTTTNVPQVKLNIMTQQQYNSATKNPTELYMITDADSGQTIQVSTLPTANASELDNIYQYVGTTGTYTNGYFYKCVSDGAASPTYSWSAVQVQAGGGSLPSQTGNAGKFLTTDGTDASWSDKPLVNQSTQTSALAVGAGSSAYQYSVAYGQGASTTKSRGVAIGQQASSQGTGTIVIGRAAVSSNNTILLNATEGVGLSVLNDPNTMYVCINNGVYTKLLASDGTIPTDRFATTPSADGNYVPTLSISSGTATRSWTSIASSVSSSSTNAETVGAKLFYDTVGDIVTLINAL